MKLDFKNPSSIEFRKLLIRVQQNDESAIDELTDYVDSIAKENIKLKEAIKTINRSTEEAFKLL